MKDLREAGADLGLTLVRAGAAVVGLNLLLSLWASPDRLASLPWFLIDLAGVGLVLTVTGPLLATAKRAVTSAHLLWLFLGMGYAGLLVAMFASRWPSYKLSWLNHLYAALPSVRSLPWSWLQPGLSPNQTGGALAVCAAFAVVVATWPQVRRRKRIPAIGLALAGTVGVFLTGSRAALAGLALALLTLLAVRIRRWLWALGAALVLAGLGLHASGHLQRSLDFFLHDETLDTKLVARLDIWTSAVHGIEDHFFSGIGLGVFNQVMPVRYPYQTVGLSYPVSQAHNLFLDIGLAIGIPGAIGFVAVIVGLVLMCVQGSRSGDSSRIVCLGVLASVIVYLVFGVTDSISLTIPTSFIVWLWACALAIASAPNPAAEPWGRPVGRPHGSPTSGCHSRSGDAATRSCCASASQSQPVRTRRG